MIRGNQSWETFGLPHTTFELQLPLALDQALKCNAYEYWPNTFKYSNSDLNITYRSLVLACTVECRPCVSCERQVSKLSATISPWHCQHWVVLLAATQLLSPDIGPNCAFCDKSMFSHYKTGHNFITDFGKTTCNLRFWVSPIFRFNIFNFFDLKPLISRLYLTQVQNCNRFQVGGVDR